MGDSHQAIFGHSRKRPGPLGPGGTGRFRTVVPRGGKILRVLPNGERLRGARKDGPTVPSAGIVKGLKAVKCELDSDDGEDADNGRPFDQLDSISAV